VVDHIADINLAYTENARRYLISEGFNRDNVYVTGSPMTEVLAANAAAIAGSDVLARMGLEAGGYFVVSMHREENVDNPERLAGLVAALNAVAAQYGKPLVFSCHPRTRGRLSASGLELDALVREVEPLDFFDYNKLQQDAYCVLSDSGTVPEEGAILGFPAVSMRDSTERPEALDGGGVVLGGVDVDGILGAIELAVKLGVRTHGVALPESPEPYDACAVRDYRDTNVAEKVVKIIASYTRIVAGRVWGRG
jgi:UDP-N-acetylglucosamine 2-epimerase (non-hydrolysing)